MYEKRNYTPFVAELLVNPDKDCIDTAVALIKATFTLDAGVVKIAEFQEPVVWSDQYHGEPGKSSVKYASEVSMPKPGTDIVMIGHAYASGRAKVRVSLKVGRLQKTVLVFGDRYWKGLLSLESKTSPKPFHKLPLIYENAYGGTDEHHTKSEKRKTFAYNPVGTGFFMSHGKIKIKGLKLPHIVSPDTKLRGPYGHHKPEGFGYFAPHWMPRAGYAGTYDNKWKTQRMPCLPLDFNPKFYNAAHPELITGNYLEGGEPVAIENASPDGNLHFKLPVLDFQILFDMGGEKIQKKPALDTLILEPDEKRFMVVYRTTVALNTKLPRFGSATFNLKRRTSP